LHRNIKYFTDKKISKIVDLDYPVLGNTGFPLSKGRGTVDEFSKTSPEKMREETFMVYNIYNV